MSENSFFVSKPLTGNGNSSKWHVYSKETQRSICGVTDIDNESNGIARKSFDPESDDLDEKSGLGDLCSLCREYLNGCVSEESLPKPSNGRKKKSNLVNRWKCDEKKSSVEVYEQ